MGTQWMAASLVGIVLAGVAAGATSDQTPPPGFDYFDYEVAAVRGKLLQEQPLPERRLTVGDRAVQGAQLRTGWRSSAELLVAAENARFKLAPRTRVRLAAERPGVLLELSRGRLHADFGALSGASHERVVTTPSAVLAVRGTSYAVEVDSRGNTTVAVFAGEVEVVDAGRLGSPRRVAAGAACAIPKGGAAGAPFSHRMSPGDWDRGRSMSPPHSPGGAMGSGRPMLGGGGSPRGPGGGK